MSPRQYVVLAAALTAACSSSPALVITNLGTAFTEPFDSLVASGTSSVLPDGWAFAESGSNADSTYATGAGGRNVGNTYSFGAEGSDERALGGLRSTALNPLFGVQLTNATGAVIDALALSYMGEQWRLGALNRLDRLDVQFSRNATSLTSGDWEDLDALDFIAPNTVGTTGALDGNDAANRLSLAASITGLALADAASVWLRWVDFDATGSDDGLAVDDFSVTARGASAAPTQAVPDSLPMAGSLGVMLLAMAAFRSRHSSQVRAA